MFQHIKHTLSQLFIVIDISKKFLGHIDRTFTPEEPIDLNTDPFTLGMNPNAGTGLKILDEKSKEYVKSKWCFDTPGVLQPDQVLCR